MVFLQNFLLLLLILATTILIWIRQKRQYWTKRNILSVPNSIFYVPRSEHIAFYVQRIYQNFKQSGQLFVGIHFLFQPTALLLDLELIKTILIEDFESFPDRGFYHNPRDDPLSGNMLRLAGEPWRRLRIKITPTFTSGKMRFMFETVAKVGERLSEVTGELLEKQQNVLDVRDLCACFTTDVIGLVAFGLECNSLREPNTEFRRFGDKVFTSFNPIMNALGASFTQLFHKLHIKAFPQELIDFYTKIVKDSIEYREQNNIKRNDFMELLLELKNTKVDGKFGLTFEEIIALSFSFFIAGFETSSGTMSYLLYELAKNPDVQEKAREEVQSSLEQHDGKITYESIKSMEYLEMVLAETLRMYPVAPNLMRTAFKDYQVPNTKHIIQKGVRIVIPVYALHFDPEYFPNPTKFEPERFTAAATRERHPMTYLPFGAGPRVCIADRFGKMQALIGIAMLLQNYRFSMTAKTPRVLDFNKKNVRIFSVSGIPLKVERI